MLEKTFLFFYKMLRINQTLEQNIHTTETAHSTVANDKQWVFLKV